MIRFKKTLIFITPRGRYFFLFILFLFFFVFYLSINVYAISDVRDSREEEKKSTSVCAKRTDLSEPTTTFLPPTRRCLCATRRSGARDHPADSMGRRNPLHVMGRRTSRHGFVVRFVTRPEIRTDEKTETTVCRPIFSTIAFARSDDVHGHVVPTTRPDYRNRVSVTRKYCYPRRLRRRNCICAADRHVLISTDDGETSHEPVVSRRA